MGGVRDGYSNTTFFQAMNPDTYSAAKAGDTVDRQDYETVTFIVNVQEFSLSNGSTLSNFFMRMQHGESNAAGTVVWSNCQESQMLFDQTMSGTITSTQSHGMAYTTSTGSGVNEGVFLHFGVSQSVIEDLESRTYVAGYVGTRRWVRVYLSISAAGDQSDVTLGVVAALGLPANWPVNSIDRVNE